MPKYMTAADRVEEAETLMAALAIVRIAGLELDRMLPILPPEFSRFLIAPSAYLLIVPSTMATESERLKVENAMCMLRSDALIVSILRPSIGPKNMTLAIGIHGRVPIWHWEYRPCMLAGSLHFVPDLDPSGPIFKLTKKGLLSSGNFEVLQCDQH